MLDLTALEQETTEQESASDGAIAVMTALFAEVEANKTNPAALQAFVDRGRAATARLSAAIVANTPAAPSA
jgi:hypothetical protein